MGSRYRIVVYTHIAGGDTESDSDSAAAARRDTELRQLRNAQENLLVQKSHLLVQKRPPPGPIDR